MMQCADTLEGLSPFELLLPNSYGTTVDYRCPTGSKFDMGGGAIEENVTITCQWNQTLTPMSTLPNCMGELDH